MCGFLLGRGIVQAEEKVEILIILHKLTSHKKKKKERNSDSGIF